ncbi:hypothetical protein H6P81_017463 [Aristolochia fimbriata]|uniref:Uncharacterized protein n=1 Tax=Aristolochia fimbriata TaxID=158543 RepID=A0AAV7E005_ARIFI|nr:hypothetical protein H6P81_017463 [Aristolochia fimbriata]
MTFIFNISVNLLGVLSLRLSAESHARIGRVTYAGRRKSLKPSLLQSWKHWRGYLKSQPLLFPWSLVLVSFCMLFVSGKQLLVSGSTDGNYPLRPR